MARAGTIRIPIDVVGMDEFRAAVTEIKAAAADLKGIANITVNISITTTQDADMNALGGRLSAEARNHAKYGSGGA